MTAPADRSRTITAPARPKHRLGTAVIGLRTSQWRHGVVSADSVVDVPLVDETVPLVDVDLVLLVDADHQRLADANVPVQRFSPNAQYSRSFAIGTESSGPAGARRAPLRAGRSRRRFALRARRCLDSCGTRTRPASTSPAVSCCDGLQLRWRSPSVPWLTILTPPRRLPLAEERYAVRGGVLDGSSASSGLAGAYEKPGGGWICHSERDGGSSQSIHIQVASSARDRRIISASSSHGRAEGAGGGEQPPQCTNFHSRSVAVSNGSPAAARPSPERLPALGGLAARGQVRVGGGGRG